MGCGSKRILFSLVQIWISRKHEARLQNFHSDDMNSSVAQAVVSVDKTTLCLHSQLKSVCSESYGRPQVHAIP